MLSMYLLLLTFKVVATVTCAVYCWRIARLNLTPTFTYMLFCAAFGLRFVTQMRAALYTREIVAVWSGYSVPQIVTSQAFETVIVGCFLIGFLRQFHGFKDLRFLSPR